MPNKSIEIVVPQKINFKQSLMLENGQLLPEFALMIETYGELNPQKNNAVLICHALSGNHHVTGRYEAETSNSGWWDTMVGPDKPIDTKRFFVVGVNNLGGCHGSSGPLTINPQTNKAYGADFPLVTVSDWVNSQALLADYLGINKWAAVVGGSLGGMQALQWAIAYPDRIAHALIIASAPKLSTQNIAFNDVARQAILTDPDFHNGYYAEFNTLPKRGLKIARMMGHITYLAEDGLKLKFGRELRQNNFKFNYDVDFEVESYLRYQGDKFANSFDANTYLLMTKALDYFDPAKEYNHQLQQALAEVKAQFFVASFSSDWRFAPERSREIVKALIQAKKAVQYVEITSNYGHDAFLMTDKDYINAVYVYMNQVFQECLSC